MKNITIFLVGSQITYVVMYELYTFRKTDANDPYNTRTYTARYETCHIDKIILQFQ